MLIVSWITVPDNDVNNSVGSESTNPTPGSSSPEDFPETTGFMELTVAHSRASQGSELSCQKDPVLCYAASPGLLFRFQVVSLMLFGKFASAKTLCASSQASQCSGRCYPAYIPRYIVIKAGHAESIVPQQLHMECVYNQASTPKSPEEILLIQYHPRRWNSTKREETRKV
ncbi:hypothetical protein KC342_g74 [Hortaea werneckii]|nr:hypothetical protein KC342_g74 [Hortaea werneckii]